MCRRGVLAVWGSVALAGVGAVSLLLLYRDQPGGVGKGLGILAVIVLPVGVMMFNALVHWAAGTAVVLALIWGVFAVENRRARRE